MLHGTLIFAATVLAQRGPTDSIFRENEEAVVYSYSAELDRKGRTSSLPVATSFAAFVDYEKAAAANDHERCDEMEKRGDVLRVESGTRCQVGRGGGMSVGPVVRFAQEIRLMNGQHKGKSGWIVAKQVRGNSRILVEPPERYTDANRDTPRPLALAFQAQDKVVYRELLAARHKAMAAAKGLPKGARQRRLRYQVYQRERQLILDRYELDDATALRIIEWGNQGEWPGPGHTSPEPPRGGR